MVEEHITNIIKIKIIELELHIITIIYNYEYLIELKDSNTKIIAKKGEE